MRLQADIEIVIGHETIRLRPTLGAAFRLDQKYDGFHNLFNAAVSGRVSALSDLIKEGSGRSSDLTTYLDSVESGQPLSVSLHQILPKVAAFLAALSGDDFDDGEVGDIPVQDRITFEEFHSRLYRLATGWLGWTPDVAWNATPAEIIEAQKGRVEMLKAVFGGKQDDGANEIITDLSTARDRLNALGDQAITNMADVP